jgi:hypothetical protein
MTIINQRWPRDICPKTCVFGRSRNDISQTSPRSRQRSVIRTGGRPLWSARCTWELPNGDRLAKLRYWLEELDGFYGSVQLWDFSSPYPFGLNLSAGGEIRTFWSYLGNRAPFNYAGLPALWALDSFSTLAAGYSAGATSIALTGLGANRLVCVQGQYIQIGRRLYIATATIESDASGNANVTFSPGLVDAVSSGTAVRMAEAACEMQLAEQNFDQSGRAGDGLVSVSATFLESATDVT